jgi:hypothetical protein
VTSRLATDEEIDLWHTRGWVVIDGLIGTDEIDDAREDLWEMYPTPEEYHADPDGEAGTKLRHGSPREATVLGQFIGLRVFPFAGKGALNRLCVHPSIIDVMSRVMRTPDVRLYQTQTWAKFTGDADYEQDMHCDANHSIIAPVMRAPWWHVEGFLFLSDIDAGCGPTAITSLAETATRDINARPTRAEDPGLYAAEQHATGVRGSFLIYRPDVFHRGTSMTVEGASRFLFNISYRATPADFVNYHAPQSRASGPDYVAFVSSLDRRQLEVIGFPLPGHPVWDAELVEATQRRYPAMDLDPWRSRFE